MKNFINSTKIIISSFLAVIMVCSVLVISPITANAWSEGETTDGFTYTLHLAKDETYWQGLGDFIAINGYNGTKSDISIPSEINGYKVLWINEEAFAYCDNINSITIPNSVTTIGNCAFSDSAVKNVFMGNGVESIGENAFTNCVNLESITMPNKVKRIEWSTFLGCTNLSSVTLNEGLEYIEQQAFMNCNNLKHITIPKSVKDIAQYSIGYVYSEDDIMHENVLVDNFVIWGYDKTAAQEYANKNNIMFISLDKYKLGDVDMDGAVTISDATLIQRNLAGMEEFSSIQKMISDVDYDTYTTISDATKLQRCLAGLENLE